MGGGGDESMSMRIFCEARPDYCLSVRGGEVVLLPAEFTDAYQEWIKDESWGYDVKDFVGFPAFSLINKGYGEALAHGCNEFDPVGLSSHISLDPILNNDVLWTLSDDLGLGFKCIRPVSNIHLNLDADRATPESGGVKNGNRLILFRFNNQPNQKWKIDFFSNPIATTFNCQHSEGKIVNVCCEARPDFFLTTRDNKAVLAPGKRDNPFQQWILKIGGWGVDTAGFQAFMLINKATMKALSHGSSKWDMVCVSPIPENGIEENLLWTQSADLGHDYCCIRTRSNIGLNLDANQANKRKKRGKISIDDGNDLILFSFNNHKNQKWKMI